MAGPERFHNEDSRKAVGKHDPALLYQRSYRRAAKVLNALRPRDMAAWCESALQILAFSAQRNGMPRPAFIRMCERAFDAAQAEAMSREPGLPLRGRP